MCLVLDEHLNPAIARLARVSGVDVLTLADFGAAGESDREVLSRAAAAARCLVTRDHGEPIGLGFEFQSLGMSHAGVLVVSGRFARQDIRGIAAALIRYAEDHPEGMAPYQVDWLRPA